jgi:hypothetical protein
MKRGGYWLLVAGFILANAFVNVAVQPTTALAAENPCLAAVNAPGCTHGLPTDQYNALLPQMQAHGTPAGRTLEVDKANVRKYSDTAGPYKHIASSFTGILLDAPPAYPMAWILFKTKPRPLPTMYALSDTAWLPRYTRVHLFASLKVNGMDWYLIGPGLWIPRNSIARLILPARPGVDGRWIAVDTAQQTLTVWENDRLVFATLISSGKGKRITRNGLTKIYLRMDTSDMSRLMGDSDDYNIFDVPFVMYFNSGMALHAAPWHDNFGTPMSHGCVNMSMTDAHWLYDWTMSAPEAAVLVWRSK